MRTAFRLARPVSPWLGGGATVCAWLLAVTAAAAQPPPLAPEQRDVSVFTANEPAQDYKTGKILRAVRVAGEPPRVDGRLDDDIWAQAAAATGFLQEDPDNGAAMSEETRIQVAYDNDNLYIAVTCFDRGVVSSGMGRRDAPPATDLIKIGLDPRHDHLTGYVFYTNPSSWQGDESLYDDDRSDGDYNANWDVRAEITAAGWTAEFRIPFSQLRFTALPAPGQVWGFDALRTIRRKGETGFWLARPRGERGNASRFGHLVFDVPLTPPGRLELTPYTVGRGTFNDGGSAEYGASAGADLRYGLGSSATLSATLNPDFGQVEQDPAVLNLSLFESFFGEKRPFFLEDSRTFVPPYGLFQVFHSRRIGRAPGRFSVAPDDTVVGQPSGTTILGAAKVTGKRDGWTYGVLAAETAREYAKVTTTDRAGRVVARSRLIEPATTYSVVRLQRDLRGSSNVGVITTGVVREASDDAYVGGFDYNLRWNRSRDFLNGHWVATRAPGDDGMKTGVGGVINAGFNRKHVSGSIHADHFGTNFRVTDLGFLRARTNRNRVDGSFSLNQPDPGPRLRQYGIGLSGGESWNDAGLVFDRSVEGFFQVQFLNYWRGHLGAGASFDRLDDRDTRGGPPIAVRGERYMFGYLESDSRKRWRWSLNVNGGGSKVGSWFSNWNTEVSFQPTDRLQASIGTSFNTARDHAQWIAGSDSGDNTDVDGDGETDYVYGTLRRNVVDITTRATYAFTRDLTLQLYMQPFVAAGAYSDVRKLARPASYEFSPVRIDYDPYFSSRSMHSNVVLRWEYTRGSTLYAVWNMSQDDSQTAPFRALRDLRTAFAGGRADHVFMIKTTFWLNR